MSIYKKIIAKYDLMRHHNLNQKLLKTTPKSDSNCNKPRRVVIKKSNNHAGLR